MIAGGPSCDIDPTGDLWLVHTQQSAYEAGNQVAKFAKRRDFLAGRVKEAEDIIQILDGDVECNADANMCDCLTDEIAAGGTPGALDKFAEFLCGPAQELIDARIYEQNNNPNSQDEGLPWNAVYGWQDEGEDTPDDGEWHIVKVEARIPSRCDDACGQWQGEDPRWPTIETEQLLLGTVRCYFLEGEEGSVKFRVTRYDEPKGSGDMMSFANGTPLWRFRSDDTRSRAPSGYSPSNLDNYCSSLALTPPVSLAGDEYTSVNYSNAFMMNEYIGTGAAANEDCWKLSHGLLAEGVVSETCARYYYERHDEPYGMQFKFVDCEPF